MILSLKKISTLLLLLFILTACGGGGSNSSGNANQGNSGNANQGNNDNDVSYKVTFETNWHNGNFATNFPSGAHFSGLIGSTHNADQVFFGSQTFATTGVQLVAETGGKSQFRAEINDVININTAQYLLNGSGIGSGIGSTSIDFDISQEFSQVTLISMIAPSPDWFVGVHNLDLYDKAQNQWKPNVVMPLRAYDAGTDDGAVFNSANIMSTPPVHITLLTSNPTETDFDQGVHRTTGASIATFTFTLQ